MDISQLDQESKNMNNKNLLLWVIAIGSLAIGILNLVQLRIEPNTSSASSGSKLPSQVKLAVDIKSCSEDLIVVCNFKISNAFKLSSTEYYLDGEYWISIPVQNIEPGVNNFQAGMPLDIESGIHTFEVYTIDVKGNKATDLIEFKKE